MASHALATMSPLRGSRPPRLPRCSRGWHPGLYHAAPAGLNSPSRFDGQASPLISRPMREVTPERRRLPPRDGPRPAGTRRSRCGRWAGGSRTSSCGSTSRASPRSCSSRRASGCGPRRSGSAGSTGSGPSARRWSCSAPLLPEGTVPASSSRTATNYLFAMTCAPDDSVVWKEQLLAGRGRPGRRPPRRGRSSARSTPRPATTRRSRRAARRHRRLRRAPDRPVLPDDRPGPPRGRPAGRRPDRVDRPCPTAAASSSPTSARRTSWSTPGA